MQRWPTLWQNFFFMSKEDFHRDPWQVEVRPPLVVCCCQRMLKKVKGFKFTRIASSINFTAIAIPHHILSIWEIWHAVPVYGYATQFSRPLWRTHLKLNLSFHCHAHENSVATLVTQDQYVQNFNHLIWTICVIATFRIARLSSWS